MRRMWAGLLCCWLCAAGVPGAAGASALANAELSAVSPGQPLTTAEALTWLWQTYAALADQPLTEPDAPTLLPAAELSEQWDKPLTVAIWAEASLRWAAAVQCEVLYQGAAPVTEEDARRALQAACALAGLEVDVATAWPNASERAAPLTRGEYARGAVAVYEALCGPQAREPDFWPRLDDTDNLAARMACGLGLMRNATLEPDGFQCFAPEREITGEALWVLLRTFVRIGLVDVPGAQAQPALTSGAAQARLELLLAWLEAQPAAVGPIRVVDNDVTAPWYFAQEETGAYSTVNCMPAAAAMALRWLDPESDITPETLRALLPMNGAAWYPEQIEEVFDLYGAEYALPEIDQANMVAALDAGHILLALLNEGDIGHCVIIKGYRQEPGGLWFTVHDPANLGEDAHGHQRGENRRMEAGYLIWAMRNHWWTYFDIAARD